MASCFPASSAVFWNFLHRLRAGTYSLRAERQDATATLKCWRTVLLFRGGGGGMSFLVFGGKNPIAAGGGGGCPSSCSEAKIQSPPGGGVSFLVFGGKNPIAAKGGGGGNTR